MLEAFRAKHGSFNNHFVREDTGRVVVTEEKEAGRGEVAFDVAGSCLVVRGSPKPPQVRWLKNLKCADGALIASGDGVAKLIIVELKGRVTPEKWYEIRQQFAGMFENALAIVRFLDCVEPLEVTCCIAYTGERFAPAEEASLIFSKVPVGGKRPIGRVDEWEGNYVDLPHGVRATLTKLVRNEGNAYYGEL